MRAIEPDGLHMGIGVCLGGRENLHLANYQKSAATSVKYFSLL